MNVIIANVTNLLKSPSIQLTGGGISAVGGIAGFFGVINPWLTFLTILIGITTAIIGLIIKYKELQKLNKKKQNYKNLHNHK